MATDDRIFSMIAERRRAMADVLDMLDAEQCGTPSLCTGWTVHHVAAHLVMPLRLSLPKAMLRLVRARGDFNRLADDWAKTTASSESVTSLARTLRERADHRFTPPGSGPLAPLTDITAHGLDIRVPLGIESDQPADQLDEVLAFLVSRSAGRGGVAPKVPASTLRIEATDTGFSHGTGDLVRGPASALVLALTGRSRGIEALEGPGADRLRAAG